MSVKKILVIVLVLLFFLSLFGFKIYLSKINSPAGNIAMDIGFVVADGESVEIIADNLVSADLISSKQFFKLYIWKEKLETKLQAGEYLLSPILSIKEIVDILTTGQSLSREQVIKIIEGWRLNEVQDYLAASTLVSDQELATTINKRLNYWGYEFANDAPANVSLEGFVFPDTYKIFKEASAEEIIRKTLDNFDNKLSPDMRQAIKDQNKTIFEIITMASIIEKEVRSNNDMEIVSGLFWNRIKNGQSLESCATLAYILGINKPQYTIEDTKIKSPYNTYQNQGLPPGPVCNPGLNAIKAAIYPQNTGYNYFLSRQDNGETVFSKTYNEHLRNKAKYLK